jgi:hypothetical protein
LREDGKMRSWKLGEEVIEAIEVIEVIEVLKI